MGPQKPTSDDQTEKKMKRPDEKELNDTNIPLPCKRFQFCLFFINIKTNRMRLNSFDGNKRNDNNIKIDINMWLLRGKIALTFS